VKRIGLLCIGLVFLAQGASAAPVWGQISFAATPSNAPKVIAAADKLMNSEVGKQFPGRLLLQLNTVDGANPATHSFVPVYRTAADREAFTEKMLASPAWKEFQATMEQASKPVSSVLYRTVKSWGDINDTDTTRMAHAFTVRDPAAFLAAIEGFMASATGKKFPGQVYLSSVVAAGMSPVTHVISVGYANGVEMDTWIEARNDTADWAAYQKASDPTADYLGASIARTAKTWGAATLADIVAP